MTTAAPALEDDFALATWTKDVATALRRVPDHASVSTIVQDIARMLLVKRHRDTVKPENQLYRFLQAFNFAGLLEDEAFRSLTSTLRDISIRLYATPAIEVFEALKLAIDAAIENERFLEVCDAAEELRMRGGREERFNALSYRFKYQDNECNEVELHVRSYDPSGPFENIPDINRFTVTMRDDQGKSVGHYEREYSD